LLHVAARVVKAQARDGDLALVGRDVPMTATWRDGEAGRGRRAAVERNPRGDAWTVYEVRGARDRPGPGRISASRGDEHNDGDEFVHGAPAIRGSLATL